MPRPKLPAARRRSQIIMTKILPAEERALDKQAKREGVTRSSILQAALREYLRARRELHVQ